MMEERRLRTCVEVHFKEERVIGKPVHSHLVAFTLYEGRLVSYQARIGRELERKFLWDRRPMGGYSFFRGFLDPARIIETTKSL